MSNQPIPDVSRLIIENTTYNVKDATARNDIGSLNTRAQSTMINNVPIFGGNTSSGALGIDITNVGNFHNIEWYEIDYLFTPEGRIFD